MPAVLFGGLESMSTMPKTRFARRAILDATAICILLALGSLNLRAQAPQSQASRSASPTSITANASYPVNAASVQIAPGDTLDVNVLDTPELSQKVRVDNGGEIDLMMVGPVQVGGLTKAQAGRQVEARLRSTGVMRNPVVSVTVLESARQISVLGEVKNPGSYPLLGQRTTLDLISSAGGLTPYASRTALLTHDGSASPVVLDLSRPASMDAEKLQPGDRIVVVRAGTVYVLGDVGKPGGYMVDEQNSMSVLQGLALAQGLNRTARFEASLIRNTSTGPQRISLDLKRILQNQSPDPPLHDGDIVYVPVNGAKDWASRGINSILQMAVGVVIYGRY